MIEFIWLYRASRMWCFYVVCFILVVNIVINVIYMSSVLKFSSNQKVSEIDIQEIQENAEFSFFSKDKHKPFQGQILVHIDLKGAPPRVSYLMEFLPFIRKLGATGILIEYEDMFPYDDGLEDIPARNAYTHEDIVQITTAAEKNNLTIIPLLPTLSHFEFVLKLEQYKSFREAEENPEVLCPSQKDIYPMLKKMIDQMLAKHPNSKYLHIGCDQSDFIGMCHKCRNMIRKNKWNTEDIYFAHVKQIAEYITTTYPGVRPIIWGHQLLQKNEHVILAHKIPDLVDVMLYTHKSDRASFPKAGVLNRLAKLFKSLWVAGAFKGASGRTRMVTNPVFHLKNTKSWMKIITKWKDKVNFTGYVFAGWQRYDHFSGLCELLPMGIPSLALSLHYLISAADIDDDKIKEVLECNVPVPSTLDETSDEPLVNILQCGFPGFNVYKLILYYSNKLRFTQKLRELIQSESFSFYNIFNNITNYNFIQELNERKYDHHLLEMNLLEKKIRKVLNEVYDEHTVDEWVMLHVMPKQMHLEAIVHTIKTHTDKKAWPRRPFKSDSAFAMNYFRNFCNSEETMGCAFFNLI